MNVFQIVMEKSVETMDVGGAVENVQLDLFVLTEHVFVSLNVLEGNVEAMVALEELVGNASMNTEQIYVLLELVNLHV